MDLPLPPPPGGRPVFAGDDAFLVKVQAQLEAARLQAQATTTLLPCVRSLIRHLLQDVAFVEEIESGVVARPFRRLLDRRIADTWDPNCGHPADLIWLDDKVAQVQNVYERTSVVMHLPLLACFGEEGKAMKLAKLRERCLEKGGLAEWWLGHDCRGQGSSKVMVDEDGGAKKVGEGADTPLLCGFVAKPRHGHDAVGVVHFSLEEVRVMFGIGVEAEVAEVLDEEGSAGRRFDEQSAFDETHVVVRRGEADEQRKREENRQWDRLLTAVRNSANLRDRTWDKECWQLSQVPRGLVIQPCYQTDGLSDEDQQAFIPPLEVKVHVLFGEVVLATVKDHPIFLDAEGGVHARTTAYSCLRIPALRKP